MALESKIEAVKKVTEALNQEKAPHVEQFEQFSSEKGQQFQSLLDPGKGIPSFQKIEGSYIAQADVPQIEKNPVFTDENVSVQGNGTATDQEQKRQKQPQTDEVEAVQGASNKQVAGSSSLMEEVKKLNVRVSQASHLNPGDLKNHARDLIAQIENVKTQLTSANAADIRPSYHNLLKNRLTHIDDSLKIALSKAGVEYVPPAQAAAGTANPIERFLGYLTQSQYQLEHLSQTIEQLNVTKAQLTPANMLALQIKVGYVQQQIELFTSLLNKALESTKTIMNVQV